MATKEGWSKLYDSQLSRYQAVFDADHSMDAKGGIILGANLTVAVFALTKGLFTTDNKILFALVILGCFIYLASIVLLIIGLWPKGYSLPANDTESHPEYITMPDDELSYQLIVDTEAATKSIEDRLKLKATLFTIAFACFIVGTIVLTVTKLIIG
jgi:hypothetical protein